MPVGLLGFAIKTIFVFLVTHESMLFTDVVNLLSGAYITFASLILL